MKSNVIVTVAVILIVNVTCTFQFDPVCVLAQCIRWGGTFVYLREVTVLNQDQPNGKVESRQPCGNDERRNNYQCISLVIFHLAQETDKEFHF